MGWLEIRHLDGRIERMGDTAPPAWHSRDDDYVCPETGLAFNDPPPQLKPKKTLRSIFWFRVQFYAYPSPWRGQFQKIETSFNPLKTGA